jgi:hypothetical protein
MTLGFDCQKGMVFEAGPFVSVSSVMCSRGTLLLIGLFGSIISRQ